MHCPQEYLRAPLCLCTQPSHACPASGHSGVFLLHVQASHWASLYLPRLFTYVNEKLFSKPTYAAFINLLNNYQRATGRGEHFTAQELAEQDTFLREIMKTAVMKELYGFLHQQSE